MKVKVCGITNLADALMCEKFGADALGFIFYKKSKRYIATEKAKGIINRLSPFTIKIGVFVDETSEYINKIAEEIKINLVQLHGNETPEIAERVSLPVIKSFRISYDFDFSILTNYKNVYYLLDSYSKNEFGGTGNKFNWQMIPEELKDKIILAGGVSINNIEEIYKNINPIAVDISSSLEREPGKKDQQKAKSFFTKLNSLKENLC
ncbi:MAG: phosphoribosylanthranilate isomerase [Bacteroidetes bacterium]|nr:phosphoribosylanthranilate isomerase [Bacteroidota bacterium]